MVVTQGFLLGEVIRRVVTGRTPGQFLRRELAGPLSADCFIGLPPEEGSPHGGHGGPGGPRSRYRRPAPRLSHAAAIPPLPPLFSNDIRCRRAGIPAANGIGQRPGRGAAAVTAGLRR